MQRDVVMDRMSGFPLCDWSRTWEKYQKYVIWSGEVLENHQKSAIWLVKDWKTIKSPSAIRSVKDLENQQKSAIWLVKELENHQSLLFYWLGLSGKATKARYIWSVKDVLKNLQKCLEQWL